MHKTSFVSVLGLAALAVTSTAVADEDWGVGVKGSTLGFGAELTKAFTPQINGRLGFNSFTYSDSQTEAGINYDGDLELQSTVALLDWHPFAGSFRVTAGYVFSNSELGLSANGTGQTVDIGNAQNVTLNAANQLTGQVDIGSGGYVGIGWGNAGKKGFGVTVDLGVVFQGAPDVNLAASPSLVNAINAAPGSSGAAAELAREEASLQQELDEFDQYPVIAIGLSYGF